MKSDRPLGSEFTNLLVATFMTNLGDGLRLTALPLLATTLTSSPFLIGALTAAQFLPWTTFAPFGGVIVDRSDRRRLIMSTQAWRSMIMAILTAVVFFDAVEIWHLFLVAFMITVGEILVDPSVVATLPVLIDRDDLDRANGRLSAVETVTNEFVGGPLGVLSFGLAPWLPFVVDAASYLGSIGPFSRLPPLRANPENQPSQQSMRAELGEGLRWIRSHPFLRPVTLAIAVFHLGTAGAFAMLVFLVTDVLRTSNIVYGIALAAAAAGATLMTLTASRLVKRFSRRYVVTGAAVITGLSVISVGAVQSDWQLVLAWAVNGAGGGVLMAIGRGFVQRHTPNDRIGRTAIAQRMITRTSFVVGALTAGVIANLSSVRWSFVVAGAFHLIGAALLWRSFSREPEPI